MRAKIGKYKISKILGEGGMARVYLARHEESGEEYAIKELLEDFSHNEEYRNRFWREIKILKQLNHLNIVRFHDHGELTNSIFLVMEYCDGMPLDAYVTQKSGPIPEERAIPIFEQVLNAAADFHKKKIVHRDIKPSNILITDQDQVKIIDFGIAKDVVKKGTRIGAVLGTVSYMSPEQAEGLTIDHRSDIYSLGVALFYVVTGKSPYDHQSQSDHDLRNKIVKEPLPRMKDIYPAASDHLQKVVDKATDKNMMLRYQSCEAFREDLIKINNNSAIPDRTMRKITVGRGNTCDIQLDDHGDSISRLHAEISFDGTFYQLKDSSRNGTLINGDRYLGRSVEVGPTSKIVLPGNVELPWDRIQETFGVLPQDQTKMLPENVNSPNPAPIKPELPDPTQTEPDVLYYLICVFIPFVGFVQYFRLYDSKPRRAKLSGRISLIGFVLNIIILRLLLN